MSTSIPAKPLAPPAWTKPFAVVWRARVYFLIAIVFYALSEIIPRIISAGSEAEWWQQWIVKAAGSLDKVSYVVFIAGVAYIVISDTFEYIWNISLQSEFRHSATALNAIVAEGLDRFTTGLFGMSYESVKVWVEGRGQISQIRSIADLSLQKCFGCNENSNDFVDFVTRGILDVWAAPAAQTWESFSISVTIRPCSMPGHFEWEEKREYLAVSASRSGLLPIRLENSFQVTKSHVLEALDKLALTIKVDQTIKHDFNNWWSARRSAAADQLNAGKLKLEDEGVSVDYDGIWLAFSLRYDHEVAREKTSVSIFENSYICDQDRCYSIAIRHPTRNLRASLSIESLPWIVKSPVVSAVLYQDKEKVVNIESHHKRTCSVSVPGWTLPGLAVVVEWTPEKPESLDAVPTQH
jgi:hypothetical protein